MLVFSLGKFDLYARESHVRVLLDARGGGAAHELCLCTARLLRFLHLEQATVSRSVSRVLVALRCSQIRWKQILLTAKHSFSPHLDLSSPPNMSPVLQDVSLLMENLPLVQSSAMILCPTRQRNSFGCRPKHL